MGQCYYIQGESSVLYLTSLETPFQSLPEVCLLDDSKFSQINNQD